MKKFNFSLLAGLVVADICFRMRRKYSGKSTGNFQKNVS